MTHLEKYSEDIAKIACSGELFGVMRGNDKPVSCRSAICQNCYSTLHGLTLMIGAHKKNAASGLIPNADVQKTIRDRISAASFFV